MTSTASAKSGYSATATAAAKSGYSATATASEIIPVYTVLPQYLLTDQGEEWGDFLDASDWTQELGTIAKNTTAGEFRVGAASITLTSQVGAAGRMYRDFTSKVFNTARPRCKLTVYLYAADIDNIDRISFLIGKSNYSNYMERAFVYTDHKFHVGWNTLEVNPDQWGSGQDATTGYQRIRVTLTPKAGTQCHISVDSLMVEIVGTPAILLTFDDGQDNVYSEGYTYLKSKGRATFFVNTSLINTAGCVTDEMLVEMDGAGWAIANHSSAITDLLTVTEAEVTTLLTNAKNTLDGYGLTKASAHVAWPSGGWSETVQAGAVTAGMLTGRHTITAGIAPPIDANFDNRWVYPITAYVESTTTLASMKTNVDNAKIYNRLTIFVFHQIKTGTGLIITPTDWRDLIDYIVAQNIPMISIADLYDSLSGSVVIRT